MTVNILNNETKRLFKATITKIKEIDFDKITDDVFDKYDWRSFCKEYRGVHKLVNKGEILGLIHFGQGHNGFVINTLELAKNCRENSKKWDYVAGCLIAFCCLKSKKKLSGEVRVFCQKDKLRRHYTAMYGMKIEDECYLISDKKNSASLIKQYLNLVEACNCQTASLHPNS